MNHSRHWLWLILLITAPVLAADNEAPQLRALIDIPVAGSLQRGELAIDTRAYANGGVLTGMTIGLMNRLMVGVYYGGENILGNGDVNWNPSPGVDARLRLLDENFALPAISIGYSNQGYGAWLPGRHRYSIKPRGFYAVASRNYWLLGNFGIHGGVNYSLEHSDRDEDINVFVGINKSILHLVEILLEYDFAFNDNEKQTVGDTHGYLNFGVRWNVSANFATEIDFKNLANNRRQDKDITRILQFSFRHTF
jgi:hypothetical protein